MPGLQATRGASLITSETAAEPAGSTPGAGRSATPLALAVAAVALVVDVASKQLAVQALEGKDPVEVVGEVLQLTLVRNPGAAFSTGESFTPAISLVAVIATLVIVRLVFKVRHRGWAVALGLLLAGVSGNLVDRIFRAPGPLRGHVVDFFELPHWPVFNVADICINAGAILMAVLLFRGIHLDGSRDG